MLHYQDLNMKLPMKNIISSNEIKNYYPFPKFLTIVSLLFHNVIIMKM